MPLVGKSSVLPSSSCSRLCLHPGVALAPLKSNKAQNRNTPASPPNLTDPLLIPHPPLLSGDAGDKHTNSLSLSGSCLEPLQTLATLP